VLGENRSAPLHFDTETKRWIHRFRIVVIAREGQQFFERWTRMAPVVVADCRCRPKSRGGTEAMA
jgi:hypothetical protein